MDIELKDKNGKWFTPNFELTEEEWATLEAEGRVRRKSNFKVIDIKKTKPIQAGKPFIFKKDNQSVECRVTIKNSKPAGNMIEYTVACKDGYDPKKLIFIGADGYIHRDYVSNSDINQIINVDSESTRFVYVASDDDFTELLKYLKNK